MEDFFRSGVHASEPAGREDFRARERRHGGGNGRGGGGHLRGGGALHLRHAHAEPAFFTRPFYDPQTFSYSALFGCTSIAVLTYIGFDGISTLSEEAENPRRNIMLATVMTCLVIGILSALEVYAAQLIWPASQPFPNVDTAYVHVAARAWAPLFTVVGFTLLLANFGSGLGAQLGAARLLYGMGRSNALPKSFFGAVDAKH